MATNAAKLHRWVNQAERSGKILRYEPQHRWPIRQEGFVPVPLPSSPVSGVIRIEVRRRGGSVTVEWPASAA